MDYKLNDDDLDAYTEIRGHRTRAAYAAWTLLGLTYAYIWHAPAQVAWASGGALAIAVAVFFYFDIRADMMLDTFAARADEEGKGEK